MRDPIVKALTLLSLLLALRSEAATGGGTTGGGAGFSVNNGQSNAVNGVKMISLSVGGNDLNDALVTPLQSPDFNGQLGIAFVGDNATGLYVGFTNSTGLKWWAPVSFYSGIPRDGHPFLMRSNSLSGKNIYLNGAAYQQSRAALPNGSYLRLENMNPFSDGNGISLPLISTNVFGSAIATNWDGQKIYEEDNFGLVMLAIPDTEIYGETNQAHSYCVIMGGGTTVPYYISFNGTLPNENLGGAYSQHYLMGFDARGAGTLVDTRNLGIHFAVETPYCWTFTNSLNRETYYDARFGHWYFYTNIYIGGALRATNEQAAHIIGPNWFDNGFSGLMVTTNMDWCPHSVPAYLTRDYQGSGRVGTTIISGQYPKETVTAGTPWIVTEASGSNIKVNTGTQTYKDKLHISTAEVTLTESSATVVFNVTIAAGKNCAGHVIATTRANDATDNQTRIDDFVFCASNKAGTVTPNTIAVTKTDVASPVGTLTTTWTAVANGASVDIKNNAVSSLAQTTLKTTWRLELDSSDAASVVTPN